MLRFLKYFLLLAALAAGGLAFVDWSSHRSAGHYLSDLRVSLLDAAGGPVTPRPPQAIGNLLLIRPQLFPADYQSPRHLRLKLEAALSAARSAGLLGQGTLVALPDHVGTWLIATGEKVEFYQSRDRYEVRDWLLLGNPLLAIRVLLSNLGADRLDEALLRMKAEDMASDYQTLFSSLAREYGVTLLAGSILLPSPHLEDGQLHAGDGPLTNLSLVFSADGSLAATPFGGAWPSDASDDVQSLVVAGTHYEVLRDQDAGYPRIRLRKASSEPLPPLYLRGGVTWPIGGAPRDVTLSAENPTASRNQPGTQVLNAWILP